MRNSLKAIVIFLVSLFIFSFVLVGTASAKTWYVDDDGAADFSTIQEAVNAASSGDTIIVKDGIYTENIDINKDHLSIKSVNAVDVTILQAANPDDHVFEVTADYVNINGFTVSGATGYWKAGIYVGAGQCRISDNNLLNNYLGILSYFTSSNTFIGNNASSNNYGICLWYSDNNNLTNNTMSVNQCDFYIFGGTLSDYIQNIDTSNTVDGKPIYYWINKENKQIPSDAGFVGIVNCTDITVRDLILMNHGEVLLAYTKNSRIENVTVQNNLGNGIYLQGSSNNTIKNNNASNCGSDGIYLWSSSGNNIVNNNVLGNRAGIYLGYSSENTILNNNLSNNRYYGIILYSLNSSNFIMNNNVLNNGRFGIYLYSSNNNKIYSNNFINNIDNVYSDASANTWNSTSKITYPYNGNLYTNYLGNYWDDYTGIDNNGDGIGDTPYIIDSDNDNYPLMQPFENYVSLMYLVAYISNMDPANFDNPAHQNALINQLEALAATIEGLNPTAALARLNNIRKRVEKWIEDEEDKAAILAMIDRLIAYLESQETPGKGKGKANKAAALASVSLPEKFQLLQNSPNPFNPSTTISYSVPEGNQKYVSLKVYDLRGRLVLTLVEGMIGAGTYTVYWDGTDGSGRQVASGVYLYRMKAGDLVQTRKMVILK